MTVFDHDKLDVYGAALEFVALSDGIIAALPRGRSHLADQLQRASISIPLNIAEGAERRLGEPSRPQRRVADHPWLWACC